MRNTFIRSCFAALCIGLTACSNSTTSEQSTAASRIADTASPAPAAVLSAPASADTTAIATGTEVKPTKVVQDYTGTWVDARSRNEEENPVDGRLVICPQGTATYVVFENQLYYTFTLRQKETGPQQAMLEFYYKEADKGRGFAKADLKEPPVGTLVATARLTAEYELTFTYLAKDFVSALRRGSPQDAGSHVFPRAFYYGMRVEGPPPLCKE